VQGRVFFEVVAYPFRKRDDHLAHGNLWDQMVDSMCSDFAHSAGIARGTDSAQLTGESD
jgi:hypothetical protein